MLFLLLAATLATRAQTNCSPTPSGLAAWWPGDAVALDIAGTNHGTLQGAATYAPGHVGPAFSFNGVDGYMNNPATDLSSISNTFTLEFWARPNASRNDTTEAHSGATGTSGQRYAIYPQRGGSGGPAGVGVIHHLVTLLQFGYVPNRSLKTPYIRAGITKTNSLARYTWVLAITLVVTIGFPLVSHSRGNLPDTDGDGMSDEWKMAHSLNPNDAAVRCTVPLAARARLGRIR